MKGARILVTRGGEQAEEFAALIRGRGGTPVLFPTVLLVPPEDPGPLDAAIGAFGSFDAILFTSANAARFFCGRAAQRGVGKPPEGVLVASVGPGTSRELRRFGFPVHLEAETHTAEGLLAALEAFGVAGKRFLFPRAEEGREVLPAEIARLGGAVDTVVAYRSGLPEKDEKAAAGLVADPPDVATFASPSAFRNFFLLLGEKAARSVLARSRIAVIGEVTARAVTERNFRVDIMPEKYTLEGMLDAIGAAVARRA